ncbi:TPA: hypothetical protein ACYKHD_000909 [Campylobacter jejuni]|nr:hypothetical protein [Campylobacter jejuni]HBD9204716.1 hypothetical protein [Campylobacter jejuni]HDV8171739.1 hypothetical protein [Campylobacter jejuni]HED4773726.1 hypothetical protein [Campylobacter jejuni]HED8252377.1 hypothetical protein [Campylobacter jejuni]
MQLSYYCFKDRKKRKMPLDTPLNTKNFKLKDKLGLNIKEQIEICNKYGITHKLYVKRKRLELKRNFRNSKRRQAF